MQSVNLNTSDRKNVQGAPLQLCSHSGMAMTGFTRSGKCEDQNDDQGSHHICIDLKSVNGLNGEKKNFCQVTGQPNWCDTKGSCYNSFGTCPRKNWCVCQWAFAAYLENAGGCDKIQKIVCEATNMEAFKSYVKVASKSPRIASALACLKQRCNLN